MIILKSAFFLLFAVAFIPKYNCSVSTISNDLLDLINTTSEANDEFIVNDSPSEVQQKIDHRIGGIDSVHQKIVDEIADLHFSSRRRHRLAAPHPSNFGTHNLVKVIPFAAVCPNSVDIQAINFYGHLVTVCISANHRWIAIARFDERSKQWIKLPFGFEASFAQRVALFVDDDILHILITDLGKPLGTDLIRINRNFELIKKEHIVDSHFTSSVAIWRSQKGNKWTLAIANSLKPGSNSNLKSMMNIYSWKNTYFDSTDQIPTFYVKDICHFVIYGMEYIAVINQRASDYDFDVDSQILKLDIDSQRWKVVQSIRTFAGSDSEHFTLGPEDEEEHFLVVANEFNIRNGQRDYNTDSIIYKFSVDKFLPFQCLKTSGATQVTAFKGDNGKFVLLVLTRNGVKMYQYNGWRFVESDLSLSQSTMGPNVNSISTLNFGGKSLVLISYSVKNIANNVFELVFAYDNPLGEWYERSLKWCNGMIRNHSVTDPRLEQDLKHVFFIDQQRPIEIHGALEFNDFSSEYLRAPRIMDESLNFDYNYEIINTLEEIAHQLHQMQDMINRADEELKSALWLSGNQRVFSPLHIKEADFICSPGDRCEIGSVNSEILNGIKNFGRGVIRTDLDQTIENLRLNSVQAMNDVFVNGLIDGIQSSSIVTTTGNHLLRHPFHVEHVSTHSVNVQGLINGHPITPNDVLLTVGDQLVESELLFERPIVVENLQAGLVGGKFLRPLQTLISGIVTTDGINNIGGFKLFNSIKADSVYQKPMSRINGVDLRNHWENLMWTTGNQQLTVSPKFVSVSVAGDVIVDGLVNGIRLPGPNIVTTKHYYVFDGRKEFLKPSFIHSAIVLSSLNGLPMPNGKLNILMKDIPQTIHNQKKFRVLELGGKSKVMGKIQGIKLSKFIERTMWKNETQRFHNSFVIDGDVRFLNEVEVGGKVANIDLNRLYDPHRTMFLNEKYFPANIHPSFEYLRPPVFHAKFINGFNIEKDFLTKTTVQDIVVPVTFTKQIIVQRPFNIETLNNINVGDIRNSLLKEGRQEFFDDIVVDGNLFVDQIDMKELNRFHMDDLIYLNRPKSIQEIYATKNFEDVVVAQNVKANNIEGVVAINNIHFRDLIENTLRFDDHQVITGRKLFESIGVHPKDRIHVNAVNGIDLQMMVRNAVYLNSPHVQEIHGKVIFSNKVSAFDFLFDSLFDGISMSELHTLVIQQLNQEIRGSLVIANDVTLDGKLVTRNGINGFDLVKLSETVVKLNSPVVVLGPTHFTKNVNIEKGIHVIGRIGGINFKNTLKKYSEKVQVIYGFQHFRRNLMAKVIHGKGWFNGIQIRDICFNSVRKYGDQRIFAPVVIIGKAITPSLRVDGHVNNLNLMRLMNEMVMKNRNQNVVIQGTKQFNTLIIEGPASVNGMLNQVNWRSVKRNYMSLTRNQVINSNLEFTAPVISTKPVVINGNLNTARGLINNISITNLEKNSVKKFGYQKLTGKYQFENVTFEKKLYLRNDIINGIKLHGDLMMKGQINKVTAPKIINGDVIVNKDLKILNGKAINGVDFSRLVSSTVYRYGNQIITGQKHFRHLRATNLFSRSPISGISFTSRNVFQNNRNQILFGSTNFINGLYVKGNVDVSGLINGIKMEDLNKYLVKKGYNNTIHNQVSIYNQLQVGNIISKSRINNMSVSDLIQYVEQPFDLGTIPVRMQRMKPKLKWLRMTNEFLSHEINFFGVTHQFKNERILEMVNKELRSAFFYFASFTDKINCESIVLKHFTRDHRVLFQQVKSFRPHKIVEFFYNGAIHILVINKRHNHLNQMMDCLSVPPNLRPPGAGDSLIQLMAFQHHSQNFVTVSNLIFEELSDVKLISNGPLVCFIFITRIRGEAFTSCLKNGLLDIPKFNHLKYSIDTVSTMNSPVYKRAMIAAYLSKSIRKPFEVNLYEWLPHQNLTMFQTIKAVNPKLVHFVETIRFGHQNFLFIGEGKASFLRNEPLMRVFRFNPDFKYPFIETQQFRVDFVSMDSIYLPDNRLIVFILTQDNFINVYEFKGTSGFQMVDTIFSNSVDTFTAKMTEASLQIALSDEENAYILSAVMKG